MFRGAVEQGTAANMVQVSLGFVAALALRAEPDFVDSLNHSCCSAAAHPT